MKASMRNHRAIIISNFIAAVALLCWTAAAWAGTVSYDGLIEPYVVVDLGTPVQGIVAQVTVDRSSPVTKGQSLVVLESSVERAALEKAEAQAGFDGDIHLQSTQLKFAKRAYERIKEVKAVSVQDKDQAATEVMLTRFRLKKAREERELAQFEMKRARALLARRHIQSPISGVVVDRYVSPGQYVSNQPLLRVAQIHPLRIEVFVPARMIHKITPGMIATIVPELEEYGAQTATVTLVDKVIDSASSTFGVRLEMPNADQKMPSGLRCQVQFEIEENTVQSQLNGN
jgi:RND family efflux transporter MFP subunit